MTLLALAVAVWLASAVTLAALWWAERREQRRPQQPGGEQ